MAGSQVPIDELIEQYASISSRSFKVIVGVFFGIALLSALARGAIRFRTQRHLSLDDYLLFIATSFLVAATGLLYKVCDGFYIDTVVLNDPTIFFQLSPQQTDQLINNALQENIFLLLAWTATFFVKFSFLAFFKQMVWRVDKMRYYYWSIVVFTVLSYLFLSSEAFILCHDFGIQSLKCLEPSKNMLYISLTSAITALDVLTDILIVSIPIILLRRAKIRASQKIGLGVFLCLSIIMVSLAIVRVSRIHGIVGIDVIWEFFWQYMETSVAVIMGSLTVVRSLLYQTNGDDNQRTAADDYYRLRLLRRHKIQLELESQDSLPEIPGAVMTGLRTFIRRHNHNSNLDTQATRTIISDHTTVIADDDSYNIVSKRPISLESLHLDAHEAMRQHEQSLQDVQRSHETRVFTHDQRWAIAPGNAPTTHIAQCLAYR
ncbi:hypothetical protein F4824DRAFT_464215 [Ustulina deusta]|nr:hypothetical protein F4824DRAFT_464215 [Ustulina deusta]